jgi:hypothetical protein
MLLLCSGLFFAAPHHRRRESSMQPCTLGGIYGDFIGAIPDLQTPRIGMLVLLGLAGVLASFYPALLVLLARWRSSTGGALLVLGGIVALLGAAVNFIVMLVSHMSLGFGTSSSSGDETPFIVVIPLVQIVFALASIAIGVSSACAGWASRVVGP